MRFIRAVGLLPLLLCACGGGGGGGGGGGLNADQQAAITLLETCGIDSIERLLETLDISVSIVDPAATSLPAIQVLSAEQAQGFLSWQLDLGGDPAPEIFGFIQFANDLGQPAAPPFDITQFVAAGLGSLDQFLDELLDGWTVTITFNSPPEPVVNLRFVFEYTSGAVSDATGNGEISGVDCGAIFQLLGASLAELRGTFPTAIFNSNYNGGGTSLGGTTDFDGTDVALVEGEVNGGSQTYGFAADLGDGTATAD